MKKYLLLNLFRKMLAYKNQQCKKNYRFMFEINKKMVNQKEYKLAKKLNSH